MIHISAGQFYIMPLSPSILPDMGYAGLLIRDNEKCKNRFRKEYQTRVVLIVYGLIKSDWDYIFFSGPRRGPSCYVALSRMTRGLAAGCNLFPTIK